MTILHTYPGGKNADYHHLINQIPPHRIYIETHAGSAAIARRKRPAQRTYLIDLNPDTCAALRSTLALGGDNSGTNVICDDAAAWLNNQTLPDDSFIYADPPYVMSARSSQRAYYTYEYTDEDHIDLLIALKAQPCYIMVSGYYSDLYADLLKGWRVYTYQSMTRGGGLATEHLWMNYPQPVELHDYRYLGKNFRERERIKRKKQRWLSKLKTMPILERQAILSALQEVTTAGPAKIGDAGQPRQE